MSSRRVTSREVALRAGVSRTTVSLVLNGVRTAHISPETRQRVLEAANELGYAPSAAARVLVSGKTWTIGLLVAQASHLQVDAFIPQLLYSLASYSHRYGYRVLLETVEEPRGPDPYTRLVREQRIDGLIAVNTKVGDHDLEKFLQSDFPLVLLGSKEEPGPRAFVVCTDGEAASERAAWHLIQLGHTRIAHITFSSEDYGATQDRKRGYQNALKRAGIPFDPELVRYGNYSAASGYLAMKDLLGLKPRPTALFAGNDTIALGALAAIREAGLRVPEDLAVVGYDDIPTAAYLDPPLTTIRSQAQEQGRLALEALVRLMRGEELSERRVFLETPLIIRKSCGSRL
jgi:DNA-binding LacI/PurR family transcriptional regulator